jgi:hypothetical protein
MPPDAVRRVLTLEADFLKSTVEVGAIFSPTGELLWQGRGSRERIAFPEDVLRGNVVTHSHPGGTPPSLQDLAQLFQQEIAEMRVVTLGRRYALSPVSGTDLAKSLARTVWEARNIEPLAIATAYELVRKGKLPAVNIERETIHAVLSRLADSGLFSYTRTPLE